MKRPVTVTLTEEQISRVVKLGFNYDAQPKVSIDRCNLCGSSVWIQLTHHDRYSHRTDAMMCHDCGNVFITPLMTEEAYMKFYGEVYRPLVSAYHGRRIDAVTLQEDQKVYSEDLVDFMESEFSRGYKPKSILDVGGSTGIILARLSERLGKETRLLSIDPAINELNEARKLGIESIHGFIESHDFKQEKFECILLCQTVDHLRDISKSLEKIHSCLSDQGLFFVDFVDFRKIYLKTGSAEGAIKIDHCYYLTDSTMEAYLRKAGFEIVKKGIARDKVHIGYLCKKATPQKLDLVDLKKRANFIYEEIRNLRESFSQKEV